jgi:hypothetical protein
VKVEGIRSRSRAAPSYSCADVFRALNFARGLLLNDNPRQVVHKSAIWTARWAAFSTVIGIILMLSKVPSPGDTGPQPNDIREYFFWPFLTALTIPVGFVISLVVVSIFCRVEQRRTAPRITTRSATMLWTGVTIFGSLVMLACAGSVALAGLMFSMDAPHAWRGDWLNGFVAMLIAAGLVFVGITSARDSLQELSSQRGVRNTARRDRF